VLRVVNGTFPDNRSLRRNHKVFNQCAEFVYT
jgi:hypothetical protein